MHQELLLPALKKLHLSEIKRLKKELAHAVLGADMPAVNAAQFAFWEMDKSIGHVEDYIVRYFPKGK